MKFKTDLIEILGHKELIAGLQISDDFLRLTLFSYTRNKLAYLREIAEEPLKDGAVSNGILKNEADFKEALSKLLSHTNSKFHEVNVSVSDLSVYSKIFSFPKAIGRDKLTEAMRVTTGFNLPVKTEDVYLDWEEVPAENANEVYLAAIPKPIIDAYTNVIRAAGLEPISFETHSMSLVRTVPTDPSSMLIIMKGKALTGLVVVRNKAIRFSRFIPQELNENELDSEIKKISSFYEVNHNESIKKVVYLSDLDLPKKFKDIPEAAKDRSWLISLGAGLRGLLPRSADTAISLMPIGTEAIYQTRKRAVFVKFLTDATVSIAGVISGAFVLVWLLMLSVQQRIENSATDIVASIPANAVQTEARAIQFNAFVNAISTITSQSPDWSLLLTDLRTRASQNIRITSFSSGTPNDGISINGIASTRTALNNFERSLRESPYLMSVNIPLTNLDKRTDIPFNASFRLKNATILKRQ